MYFDDLLTDYLGEFGRYQIFLYSLMACIALPAAFNTMGIVFIAGVPDHWCDVPVLNNFTEKLSDKQLRNITAPPGESCKMYNQNYSLWTEDDINGFLVNGPPVADIVECTSGMAYSDEVYKSTIVTEWDLVCENDVVRATTSSVYMAGFMVGVIITGNLSDIFGRRPVFFVCLTLLIASSIGVSFAPNVIAFCILRFLVAFFNIGSYTTGFIIAMEIVGIRWRMHAGISYQYFWAFGYLLYTLYAYFIRDWRTLYLATSASCSFLFIVFFFLPESPRWLYTAKKHDEADKVVRKMAKWNRKTLPEPLEISVKSDKKGYIWDLFKTPRMRLRTFNVMFNWFVNSFVYYGLSLSSSNLGGNDYINFAISGGVEIPAYIFCQITLAYLGRRWPLAGTMIIGGVSLLAIIPIPEHLNWLAIAFSMLGKFCISASFAIIYVLTAEVYPTVTRHIGVATGSFMARVGGITAPYVGLLSRYGDWVPMLIFGACSVAAGVLALAFPETKDKKLPETIEEGEAFGMKISKVGKYPVSMMNPSSAENGNQKGLDNPGYDENMGARI